MPLLPSDAVRFELAAEQLGGQYPALTVMVPGGQRITFRTEIEAPEPGMTGLRGWSDGRDRLNLFAALGRLHGEILASGGHYRLVEREGGNFWASVTGLPVPAHFGETVLRGQTPIAAMPALREEPDAKGAYRIDLLMLLEPTFIAAYGGVDPARAKAQRLVFLANTYLANSGVSLKYRVAAIEEFDAGTITTMDDLAGNPEVKKRRNRHDADLVTYLTGGGCASFASAFNSGQDTPDGQSPQYVDPENHAFSVVNQGTTCREDTLAHELGHNVGAGHDFAAGATLEWKDYAHGWDCGNAGAQLRYASVMHYGYVAVEARGDFFSTPSLVLDGQPCGSTGPVEPLMADNVRAMGQAIPYVAAYRGAKAAKAQAGGGGGAMTVLALLFPGLGWACAARNRREARRGVVRRSALPHAAATGPARG